MKPLMAWKASDGSLEKQFARVDMSSGKEMQDKVNREAIAGVLQSLQPPPGLESLDRSSSKCE